MLTDSPAPRQFGALRDDPRALSDGGARSRSRPARQTSLTEALVIGAISATVLFAVGCWVTLGLHVVYFDAASRLTHAYLVFWNHPAKLASIGFVWPPLQSLALLPFALIKPLATSLVALPLSSALCGGVMLATLNRTLALIGLRWNWRYPLLLLFGLNPLWIDYASNGMAEILYLMLLTLGLHYFISWHLGGGTSYRKLALSGTWMGLAFLARYELIAWIGLMTLAVIATHWRRRTRWADLEAPVLVFLAPTLYLCAAWSVISMEVVGGGPLAWFSRANDQSQGTAITHHGVLSLASDVFMLTGRISPLLWIVPVALIAIALRRRDWFTGWLAVLVLTGAAVTFLLVLTRPSTGLLQPRYNIRSLPAMLIGAGWVLRSLGAGDRPLPGITLRAGPGIRSVAAAVIAAGLIAAVPLAFILEEHYPYQFEEHAWANAVITGQNQTGNPKVGGDTIGVAQYQRLADWINRHDDAPKSVLIDDGAFPEVILLSGRPGLFLSRVDHGDAYWLHLLSQPWGRVRYMIVGNPHDISGGFSADLIQSANPTAYEGGFPGTHVVFRTRLAAIVAVDPTEPINRLLARAQSSSFSAHGRTARLSTRR